MKLTLSSISPAPVLSRADRFPVVKKKWLSSSTRHRVKIGPDQAAVIVHSGQDGSARLYAPQGTDPVQTTVDRDGSILMFHREFTLTLGADQLCFKDGVPGKLSLVIKLRIMNPARSFTAFFAGAGEQDLKKPDRFILNRISLLLAPAIEARVRELAYTAELTPMDITDHLKGELTLERMADPLMRQAGLKPLSPLICTEVCAPLADDARERKRMQSRRNEALTLEAEYTLLKLKLETEIEAARSKKKQVSALKSPTSSPLSLLTCWRSYNFRGELTGMPGNGYDLPSGSGLDVMVTVNRYAWVYVVNFSSAGKWQQMVPEPENEGEKIMYLTRTHFQQGQQARTWPGENNHPGRINRLPLWRLNAITGLERLYVIASLDFIDMEAMILNGGIHQLVRYRARAGNTRCLENFCLSSADTSHLPEKDNFVVQGLTIRHL